MYIYLYTYTHIHTYAHIYTPIYIHSLPRSGSIVNSEKICDRPAGPAGRPAHPPDVPNIHAYMHTCIHAYMHTCIHAYMYACMHACIHAYMHTCIHAYMHTCIHACTYTCMHLYMQTGGSSLVPAPNTRGKNPQSRDGVFKAPPNIFGWSLL